MGNFRRSSRYVGFEESMSSEKPLVMMKSVATYMNLQGGVVAKAWNAFQKHHSDSSAALVVIHDEIQLPQGKVQVRVQNTSARGHNGLRSIDSKIGPEYVKISVGVGKPNGGAIDKYVLGRFTEAELDVLSETSLPRVEQILHEMVTGKHIFDRKQ